MLWHKLISFNDFEIVTFGWNDYRIKFCFITKNKTVDRMKNVDLKGKSRL